MNKGGTKKKVSYFFLPNSKKHLLFVAFFNHQKERTEYNLI
jgi:hypothetical protein